MLSIALPHGLTSPNDLTAALTRSFFRDSRHPANPNWGSVRNFGPQWLSNP